MPCHDFHDLYLYGGPSSQVNFEVSGIEEKELDVRVKIARPQLGLPVLVVASLMKRS